MKHFNIHIFGKILSMDLNKKVWQWTLLIFISMIWGTSFILMKKGLNSYSNNQVAALRMFFSFIILLPVIIARLKRLNRKNLPYLIIVGVIGNGIPAFLFTKAQTEISSSLAGMLNSATPIFTLIIAVIFFRSRFMLINIVGLILGLIGTFGLIYNGSQGLLNGNNWYALYVILATICYAISVNVVKNKLEELDGLTITSIALLFIGPFAGIYLLTTDFSAALATPEYMLNLGYIFILALLSSVIAIVIFNILIKYTTAIFAASVTYIIPIFAILWGLFDGEKVSLNQYLWMSVILFGVYLVNKKKLVRI